jgi:hypothetical protein
MFGSSTRIEPSRWSCRCIANKRGTLNGILRDAGLSRDELREQL